MPRLTETEIRALLTGDVWRREGETIVRDVQVKDFVAAIALVNGVAQLAEAAGHHPDILVHGFNNVRLALSTHSEGGLTDADFDLAAQFDALITRETS
ncbi:4a-hydroxytetrahydrobiopterin dehydratase [Conexibacter sp. CPCC 206217]|uniref:4a-hydroxytetrahydrobiopterin dehydratase n=1 Tax=Conexibacter sp. CPCC 206217 TaxID=3064574 RepID=UPI00271B8E1A|nr:4a-hydroxytetrahydrobiopterin dehydratase [Conexibacter sp. CPCC 206217]MDO8209262.1 4a-hydroxytetrahydrobiopterin dehydratase [Conexibacter sp. CPCC 206217]